ncbi:MAG: SDR family NAD(P)-dependent oxidoreductase [Polaromonas sp.]|uniref:SDR family NAD(P)-dependent oxidoreductase n=1 Tax=Polaromonas sp. TaxID=1869339 RepID=UPI0025EC2E7B|nr:SDR family NAD(P)-dependent oxidoreductase [Polaromonas sp.]MBI2725730.1 SDR family NAD(P)-dependent oxidoreductase [Polaromonas sp.]
MSLNPPITSWHGKTVWLVGASTGIGRATAHALHAAGAKVIVSARNQQALDGFAAEHPGTLALAFDAGDAAAAKAAAQTVLDAGPLDLVLYCAGYYKEMRATEFDLSEMLMHQQVNYVGALYVLDAVLPYFAKRQSGHISLISSVAGYRGLPKSLAYGPTKAALINLAETLYVDLQDSHVGVSLICPGFVETPLTAQNKFTMPALITPEVAAQEILKGWAAGSFEIHFPKRFTLWMKALALLPARLYFPVIRKFTGL